MKEKGTLLFDRLKSRAAARGSRWLGAEDHGALVAVRVREQEKQVELPSLLNIFFQHFCPTVTLSPPPVMGQGLNKTPYLARIN
ncbi:hypothetical protein EYF80_006289 [Liparis tanakae]|uniref:Uncharacterized protein n=1 Tax=Liparis tanakae TaxID=230148 RepID=A0A4Z2J0W1_9TELE|nr:hypothetical protein EYF80_006289 [Liparis tanakae]